MPTPNDTGAELAWAHRIPETTKVGPGVQLPEKWELVTAKLDQTAVALSDETHVPLPARPGSISWDKDSHRWLVVAAGAIWWLAPDGANAALTKVPELSWRGVRLSPTALSICATTGEIALAATLERALPAADGKSVLTSLVFRWDAAHNEVDTIYDPFATNLPRRVFAATQSSWATMLGNGNSLGLGPLLNERQPDEQSQSPVGTP